MIAIMFQLVGIFLTFITYEGIFETVFHQPRYVSIRLLVNKVRTVTDAAVHVETVRFTGELRIAGQLESQVRIRKFVWCAHQGPLNSKRDRL